MKVRPIEMPRRWVRSAEGELALASLRCVVGNAPMEAHPVGCGGHIAAGTNCLGLVKSLVRSGISKVYSPHVPAYAVVICCE